MRDPLGLVDVINRNNPTPPPPPPPPIHVSRTTNLISIQLCTIVKEPI